MSAASGNIYLRDARLVEADALSALHVDVWRDTYRNLATREAYETLGVERRLPYWRNTLASEDPLVGAIVGCAGDEIAGVISFGASQHPALDGAHEIKHLYVRTSARGVGLGRQLLQAALDHLGTHGLRRVALAVVEENAAAREFYRRMGGVETERFVDPGPLWRSANVVVMWELAAFGEV